jgi:hypothetical protein
MSVNARFTRDFNPQTGQLTSASSVQNLVEFNSIAIEDEEASATSGRPVYREIEAIRIIVPGDGRSVVERTATPTDKVMYAKQYEAFIRKEAIIGDGTPLEEWSRMSTGLVRTLKSYNVFSVDQLAALGDETLSQIGMLNGRLIRRQAQEWLLSAKTGSVSSALVHEAETLRNENITLKANMALLMTQVEGVMRAQGLDPSKFNPGQAQPLMTPPTTFNPPTAVAEPEIPLIPHDFETMRNDEVMALATRIIGIKFTKRTDAIAALREIKAAK